MFEFGIFPDDASAPAAIFVTLEDAIDWGVHRYGADKFSIRHCPAVVTETEADRSAPPRHPRLRS
jgi:hypothetical protein